ncbi:DUF7660 family protein [Actomonas aquatica]|uniref:DUF7660 family protein n=1 Tax=Actomonas aquatica TaxID=2866162 RepID=UPI003CCDB08E
MGEQVMSDSLQAKLDAVCDEVSFVAFVSALASDRADELRKEEQSPSSPFGPGANGWENATVEAFLESAAAWAESSKRSPQFRAAANPWKRCAEILHAGKHYE